MKKEYYEVKNCKLAGTSYGEVYKKAWRIYLEEKMKSKRRVYLRSAYFNKEKIFLDIFWKHLKQKNKGDRERRLKFYYCALTLLKRSKNAPVIKYNQRMKFYRFYGKEMSTGDKFVVQIKESTRGNKYLMSIFPEK